MGSWLLDITSVATRWILLRSGVLHEENSQCLLKYLLYFSGKHVGNIFLKYGRNIFASFFWDIHLEKWKCTPHLKKFEISFGNTTKVGKHGHSLKKCLSNPLWPDYTGNKERKQNRKRCNIFGKKNVETWKDKRKHWKKLKKSQYPAVSTNSSWVVFIAFKNVSF